MARRPLANIRAANESARAALSAANAARPAGDHLGDLAWWDPNPSWTSPVAEVARVFAKHGLDPVADLPAAPDWQSAFGRAVARMRVPLEHRDYKLIEAQPGAGGERRMSIVKFTKEAQVTSRDRGTVTCPKTGAAAFVERDDPDGVGNEVLAKAASLVDVYTSDDIRNGIVMVLERWQAMPCRQAPPHMVYWVPPAAGETVRHLADAVEELGWGRIELFAGYASDERSKRACVNAVNQGLEAQLSEFAERADAYASESTKTRASTIETKLVEAAQLRQQASLYREILGAAVVAVDARVKRIEDSLRATLGVVSAA